ncbi:MAG: tyrosine-type recombinase/integrase [Janthinobacterium lividum]
MPAEPRTIDAYLASLGDIHAPNTIRRRLSAIGKAHQYNSLDWNTCHRDIQEPLCGAPREHGRPPRPAAALKLELLQRLLDTCDLSPGGRRDRAMLLIGFAAALRRSELVRLKVSDITATRTGWRSGSAA